MPKLSYRIKKIQSRLRGLFRRKRRLAFIVLARDGLLGLRGLIEHEKRRLKIKNFQLVRSNPSFPRRIVRLPKKRIRKKLLTNVEKAILRPQDTLPIMLCDRRFNGGRA